MKYFPLKFVLPMALGLGLILALLSLMTSLNTKAVLAAGPHHVAPNCTGVPAPCYTSIQAAVDAATPGDLIMVAAGTYTSVNVRLSGAFNSVFVTQTLYLSKNVTIRGGYSTSFTEPPNPQANPAILDAQGKGRVIYSVGVSPTIEGLTIVNGDARVAGDPANGPMYVSGGGIYAISGNPVISGNNIANSVAYFGGGVDVFSGRATLSHNVIASNIALTGGGGVYVVSGTITMINNQLLQNSHTNWSDQLARLSHGRFPASF